MDQMTPTAPFRPRQRRRGGMGEAILVPTSGPDRGRMRRFRTAPRATPHVRHRREYTDILLPSDVTFVFTIHGAPTGMAARTAAEFRAAIGASPGDVVEGHRRRHDFSRWMAKVFHDRPLAARVLDAEQNALPATS